MPRLYEKLLLLCALTAVAAGCKPKIGEDCKLSTDCSAAGDRLCDITAPGGYCTIFNCEPGTCPEDESLCVEFGAQRSPVCGDDKQSPSPYARTFCMATCDDNSDCRSGYRCEDLSDPGNSWGALLIDGNRGNKACVVPPVGEATPTHVNGKPIPAPDVCKAEVPMSRGGSGSGGASGSGGGGASGSAGGSDASAGQAQGGAGE
jgi:hypothetical protein